MENKNEFKYKNLKVYRSEIESWPFAICTGYLSDSDMAELAKNVYHDLAANYGWGEKSLNKLLLPNANELYPKDWETVQDNIVSSTEYFLIEKYGAKYYEDIESLYEYICKKVVINGKEYPIYKFAMRDDNDSFEKIIFAAPESLECIIEEYSEKGKYEIVREIDESFDAIIPNELIEKDNADFAYKYLHEYYL